MQYFGRLSLLYSLTNKFLSINSTAFVVLYKLAWILFGPYLDL